MIFLVVGMVCLIIGWGLYQWQSILEENVPSIPENSSFSDAEKSVKLLPLVLIVIGAILIVISIVIILAEEVFS